MTGEIPGRPNQRMSRFSQAHRTMPGAAHATLDEAFDRADADNEASQWQRGLGDPPSFDVIEVEFETVPPLPLAAEAPIFDSQAPKFASEPPIFERQTASHGGEEQPAPPDIEAIAAALAEEMDRTARSTVPQPDPRPEPQPRKVVEAAVIIAPEPIVEMPEPRVDSLSAAFAPSPPAQPPAAPARPSRIPLLAKRSARFAREKAAPALGHAALWLAHNLQRKEIRRRYGKAVALVHGKVLDRRLERHFYLPTLDTQRFAPDLDRGIAYEGPVPARAFAWVLAQLPEDLREYAFVDFRAGRGRAMLLAAQRNFDRIIGFEYGPVHYDDLQMNLAQFPRSQMVCRNIQAFRADRLGVSVPDQPAVLYVANAWREELLSGIMNYVRSSYTNKPRRFYLILENTDKTFTMPQDEIFQKQELPLAQKLKLRLFSPMDFQVYRSAV
jgi:hypothetical protein